MTDERSGYWLYRWLDENDVDDIDKFATCLDQNVVLSSLRERAAEVLSDEGSAPLPSNSIVAGSDLDLSGRDSCQRVECRIRQVDEIFHKAWLYFDQIVVDDTVASIAGAPVDPGLPRHDDWKRDLIDSVRIALHVRTTGVDSLLSFDARQRRQFCREHAQEVVSFAGIADLVATEHGLAVDLRDNGTFEFELVDGQRMVSVQHPGIIAGDGLWHFEVGAIQGSDDEVRADLAESLAHTLISITVGDLATCRDLSLPLGTTSIRDRKLLELSSARQRQDAVAFNLELPVLHNIPIEVLLDIRRDDADLFERFRISLRKAISERIKVSPDAASEELADEIRRDIIEPELARIRVQLKSADKTLARKSGVQLGVGAILTSCGLLTGILPITILGVGAMASGVVQPAQQRIDMGGEVAMSEMFFLWKAVEHAK